MPDATYEFTPAENETIQVLARRMKFVGIFNIIIGILYGLSGLVFLLVQPLMLLVYLPVVGMLILIGVWTNSASSAFKMIVQTAGQDIMHLMSALENLRKLYNLQFWLLVIGLALVVIFIIIGLVVGINMSGAATM